jgi:hypothetical protein
MSLLDKFLSMIDRKMSRLKPIVKNVSGSLRPFTQDKSDKNTTNLYIGKIIDDGNLQCEVMNIHNTNFHIKVLKIYWDRLGTYLDVDKVYPVYKHRSEILSNDEMQIWEISPKRMKRNTSQVLFYWEEGIGWSWDIDT